MIREISKIKIQGGNFEDEANLTLFEKNSDCFSILFGRNGSGKTTISRAFHKLIGADENNIVSVSLIDYENNHIDLSETDKNNIFIFNEDYVENKIRVQENGLNTIVLLGNQIELEDKINKAIKEEEKIQKEILIQESILAGYEDQQNTNSPLYFKNLIYDSLKGDENWAGRERTILGNKQNASVKKENVLKILKEKTDRDEVDLISEYTKVKDILDKAKSGKGKITETLPCIESTQFNLDNVKSLLSKRIEKPELSEREKKLLNLLNTQGQNELYKIKKAFSKKEVHECPFCFQTVTETYKQDLIKNIEHILTKIVENHKKDLEDTIIKQIDYENIDKFREVDTELVDDLLVKIKQLNQFVEKVNGLIMRKIEHPYDPINDDILGLNHLKDECASLISQLRNKTETYNSNIEDISQLQSHLQLINRQLAYLKIYPAYEVYKQKLEEQNKVEEKLKKVRNEKENLQIEIRELIAQKRNIKIAAEIINQSLSYIFFSPKRLQLKTMHDDESNTDTYQLFSRGHSVKPSQISAGERNIIALAYFFTEIFENHDPQKGYSDNILVVIDDPISSFDFENKIGILSFLKAKFQKILIGNRNSRILVMTHDLEIMHGMDHITSEILKKLNRNVDKKNKVSMTWHELSEKKIIEFKKSRNDYRLLMKEAYLYACQAPNEMDLIIGNILRRLLESFSTFIYQKSIEDISCDETILNQLPTKEQRTYFENLMYRLILHGQSHMQERINICQDYDFTQNLSSKELQKTARSIICFMYLLQKSHVLIYLADEKKAENQIKEWCKKINTITLNNQ